MSTIFYNRYATGKGDGSTPKDAYSSWDDVIEQVALGGDLWVKPKRSYGVGERMAEILKVSGRVYAGLKLLLGVSVVALVFSLDSEVYGGVMMDALVSCLALSIPLLALAVFLELMRLMNRPYGRKLSRSQEELLDMSSRLVAEVINAKRKRDGGKGYEGEAEFTPEEWDEVWNACRPGRPE